MSREANCPCANQSTWLGGLVQTGHPDNDRSRIALQYSALRRQCRASRRYVVANFRLLQQHEQAILHCKDSAILVRRRLCEIDKRRNQWSCDEGFPSPERLAANLAEVAEYAAARFLRIRDAKAGFAINVFHEIRYRIAFGMHCQ